VIIKTHVSCFFATLYIVELCDRRLPGWQQWFQRCVPILTTWTSMYVTQPRVRSPSWPRLLVSRLFCRSWRPSARARSPGRLGTLASRSASRYRSSWAVPSCRILRASLKSLNMVGSREFWLYLLDVFVVFMFHCCRKLLAVKWPDPWYRWNMFLLFSLRDISLVNNTDNIWCFDTVVGWQEGHSACKHLCHLSPKVLYWKKWRKEMWGRADWSTPLTACLLYVFTAFTLLVGRQEEHLIGKKWVMRCWCGYLSGVRCK